MGFLDELVDATTDYIKDNGDDLIKEFKGFLSEEDDEGDRGSSSGGGSGDDGGDESFGGMLGSFLGVSDDEEGSGNGSGNDDDDGWYGKLGGLVDRLSGDGGRDDLWDRAGGLVERFGRYLPEEVRDEAGRLLGLSGQDQSGHAQAGAGGRGSSWWGSLLDPGESRVPRGWHAVANHPTVGQSFGELGFGGFHHHSLANLAGNHGIRSAVSPAGPNGGPEVGMIADPIPGGVPDPRVSMPTDLVRPNPFRDANGDGWPDGPGLLARPGYDANGDGVADQIVGRRGQVGYDVNGDGTPDRPVRPGEPGYDGNHDGRPDDLFAGPAQDDQADYDDLVTSGAGPSVSRHQVYEDFTFPTDPSPDQPPNPAAVSGPAEAPDGAAVSGPAPVSVEPTPVEPPPSDFQQSIDTAEQVDQQLGTMFNDLDGQG